MRLLERNNEKLEKNLEIDQRWIKYKEWAWKNTNKGFNENN